ncbi:MAG: hypothetical protein ACE5JS_14925, partial [Nitrospinota bacterium]
SAPRKEVSSQISLAPVGGFTVHVSYVLNQYTKLPESSLLGNIVAHPYREERIKGIVGAGLSQVRHSSGCQLILWLIRNFVSRGVPPLKVAKNSNPFRAAEDGGQTGRVLLRPRVRDSLVDASKQEKERRQGEG